MEINKKIKTLELKLSKILNWWLFWAYKSKFSGNWMEFDEHKEYEFWDSLKDIDWKASSKTWTIYSKKYEEQRDLNVLFVLDNSKTMSFGSQNKTKKETLEEVFYSLALSAYYNNDNIWWFVFDEKELKIIDYQKTRENIYKILDVLEWNSKTLKVELENNNQKVNKILDYLIKNKTKNNLIFLLTDDIENISEKKLRLISSLNDLVIINIFDIFENELVDFKTDISLKDDNNFINISLDKNKSEKYKIIRKNKIKFLKEICIKNSIWYIYIDNNTDIFFELMKYFNWIKK